MRNGHRWVEADTGDLDRVNALGWEGWRVVPGVLLAENGRCYLLMEHDDTSEA